jgi:prolyl-tRNA editing enzyme YbaK/EbsC (Cys-tRNA(Pro) deacylase)
LHSQAVRVQNALNQAGATAEVRELPDSTRTAVEAAQAVGCEVAQIVKSLIFILEPNHQTMLVLVSGVNRVNEKGLGDRLAGKLVKANAAQVEHATGFVIGGVPPVGHPSALITIIDADLLQYEIVWAAAGTPHAVFPISPTELVRITRGTVMDVK